MNTHFDILYNTHYAAVVLGTEHSKGKAYINIAESMNKSLKPNQIIKGQKIYDYDNSFYMNIISSEMAKLDDFLNKIKDPNFMENFTIVTDQSKSQFNNQNVKTKTLSFVCVDKNKQRIVDQNGNFCIIIFANFSYMDGTKRYIDYKCSYDDVLILRNWTYYSTKIMPGITALANEYIKLINGKDISEYKYEIKNSYSNDNNYNQQQQTYSKQQNHNNNYNQQQQSYSKQQNYNNNYNQQQQAYSKSPSFSQQNNSNNNVNDIDSDISNDFIF